MSKARVPLRVLVADDNPLDFELVSEVLQPRGHTVQWAQDGAGALAAIQGGHYDVVLLDLHMPYMDGHNVITTLRADLATRDLRVIVLSADAVDWVREEVLAVGATAYLTKPLDLDLLIATVEVPESDNTPWWRSLTSLGSRPGHDDRH